MSAAIIPTLEAAVEIAGAVLPDVIKWILSLIHAGHSPTEAKEIVRRDIQTRQKAYEAARDKDVQALHDKWGDDDATDD